jgi:hypothetical protein
MVFILEKINLVGIRTSGKCLKWDLGFKLETASEDFFKKKLALIAKFLR